jgi:ABC-type uncharacterized transport system involved in gliding motility auxiliary subunit
MVNQNNKRWDLTEDKTNTLAPETIAALQKLPQKVEADAYFTQRTSSTSARTLLDQYKFASKGNFDYQFIDPEANPAAAKAANITQDGTVVLKMGNRSEPVTSVSEQEISGALVRLISNQSPKVYFLTGHGEKSPNDSGNEAYSQVKQTLTSKNYKVDVLNLLTSNKIPDDAKVIVIAGPKKPVSQQEVDMLKAFVSKGGSLIVMEDPLPVTDFGNAPDPLANYLSDTWGITLGKDIVVDLSSQQPFLAVANQYGQNPITDKLQGLVSFFPNARSVTAAGDKSGLNRTQLVLTSANSWAETDLASLQGQNPQLQFKQGQDIQGPISLAVAAQSQDGKQRVVVFGNSEFATDANYSQYGNGDLLINSFDWATQQENLINLTPKQPTQRLLVPPERVQVGLIFLGSIVFLPAVMLVAGVFVFVQRRKRG